MKKLLLLLITFFALSANAESPVSLNIFDNVQVPGDNSSSIRGIRFNIFYGVNQSVTGVDFPVTPFALNIVKGNMTGAQFGLYNQVDGSFKGAQFAVVNNSGNVTGVQWGLVNLAKSLKGLQIGLVNINKAGTPIPQGFSSPYFFPIVNWSF